MTHHINLHFNKSSRPVIVNPLIDKNSRMLNEETTWLISSLIKVGSNTIWLMQSQSLEEPRRVVLLLPSIYTYAPPTLGFLAELQSSLYIQKLKPKAGSPFILMAQVDSPEHSQSFSECNSFDSTSRYYVPLSRHYQIPRLPVL